MRGTFGLGRLSAAALALACAAPVRAAEEPAKKAAEEEPEKKYPSLSVDLTAVSDYRFRGVSLSGGEPAFQAEATLEVDPSIYATAWASTIEESEGGAEVELQFALGYTTELWDGFNLDLSINYYAYPSDSGLDYIEGALELTYEIGEFTPKIGLQYTPEQAALQDELGVRRDNLYAYAGLDLTLGKTPVTLSGQLGHETGAFDTLPRRGKWDWRLGAKAETKWLNLGLDYVGSNGRLIGRRGRNLAGDTVVAWIGRSF